MDNLAMFLAPALLAFAVVFVLTWLIASQGLPPEYFWLLFLGPIGLVVLVLAIGRQSSLSDQVRRGAWRRCPHCAERIQGAAKICRYCGREVPRAFPIRA